jgi:cell fate regulator YaaT (PSP1 superfamily)
MATVVGVVFSPGGKVYSFDPSGLELAWNEKIICQTSRGREYGRVVQAVHEVPDAELMGTLKRVVRRATAEDAEVVRRNRDEAKRAIGVFREVRTELDVDVHPVSAEIVFDGSRVVFAYRTEGRPEVSRLQKELARRLRRRIELRSVGPREQSRLCGGHGLCGTQLCCTRFPSHEQPITLRMAKDQDLPMTSGRLTGLCGRLRCCLAFEHPVYRSFRDRAPRVGARVHTPLGAGVVRSYEVIKDACLVELDDAPSQPKGQRGVEVAIDDCREVEGGGQRRG